MQFSGYTSVFCRLPGVWNRCPHYTDVMTTRAIETAWLDDIEIVGGHLALDFVNTVHSRTEAVTRDYLDTPEHLFGWCVHQEIVGMAQAGTLARLSASKRDQLLGRARCLRATLHALFDGYLHGRPDPQALDAFNHDLEGMSCWRRLDIEDDRFAWYFRVAPAHPESLFAPIVFAAAELLRSTDLARLKACPPPQGCGWLFLDRSRNGSRTWCNMKTCGNLAKQRRHRARRLRET